MRVLHVLHNSLPVVCGYSIRSGYILRLEKQEGLEVKAVTSAQHLNGPAMRDWIDGIEHRRTPGYQGKPWPVWREWQLMRSLEQQVARAVDEWRPDLIHAHSPVLVGLPALRVARRSRLPFVYEVRDLWENASVDRGRFSETSALYRAARGLESHVLARADAVVTICDSLRAELSPRASEPGRVHVVANGVDTAAFKPGVRSAAVVERYHLAGKRVVLYVGTFQPYEGLETLVRALPGILRRAPDAHLVIAGGSVAQVRPSGGSHLGTQEQLLATLVSELGVQQSVTMTGLVPHEVVADLYPLADVVVYPRRNTRTTALTTPLKPLEAMAAGKAVVVSDLPPMRELVRDRQTGLHFPAADASALAERCLELFESPQLRDSLGRAAREFVVAERQWSHLVAAYPAIYRAALARAH